MSAPCDMDASRQRCDPPKAYQGIRVQFPFEKPMHPQDQVCVCVIVFMYVCMCVRSVFGVRFPFFVRACVRRVRASCYG